MADRIQKEKDFHNNRFEHETRATLDKYYSVSFLIDSYYQDVLYKNCYDKRALEYGCGLSSHSFKLTEIAKEVHAIDISEIAIEKAKNEAEAKGLNNIFFEVMNAESLDFGNNYFDVVCGTSILHHLELKSAYAELARILKPEGKAYFIEPLGHNFMINLFRKLTSKLRTEDEHPLLIKDLKLLNKYFQTVDIKYYYFISLLAVPFRKSKYFDSLLSFLNSVDQFLFKSVILRTQAWQVVIEVCNPRK